MAAPSAAADRLYTFLRLTRSPLPPTATDQSLKPEKVFQDPLTRMLVYAHENGHVYGLPTTPSQVSVIEEPYAPPLRPRPPPTLTARDAPPPPHRAIEAWNVTLARFSPDLQFLAMRMEDNVLRLKNRATGQYFSFTTKSSKSGGEILDFYWIDPETVLLVCKSGLELFKVSLSLCLPIISHRRRADHRRRCCVGAGDRRKTHSQIGQICVSRCAVVQIFGAQMLREGGGPRLCSTAHPTLPTIGPSHSLGAVF